MKPHQKAFMIIGTVAVMAASGIVGYTLFATPNTSSSTTTTTMTTSTQPTASTSSPSSTTTTNTNTGSSSSTSSSSYKDGTYTGTASYMVPHGDTNTITATVTIKDGKVVSASAQHNYNDGESERYISSFDSSLSSSVAGESLGSISVYRIGGASLTTEAFSQVLDTISSQAQA